MDMKINISIDTFSLISTVIIMLLSKSSIHPSIYHIFTIYPSIYSVAGSSVS